MPSAAIPSVDPSLSLPEQLQRLRRAHGKGIMQLAERTGLSRVTVSASEGHTDPRLSTLVSLFDALGYILLPVPKGLANEVASFINNGGVSVSLPAGRSAPMGVGQRVFAAGTADGGLDPLDGQN